MIAPNNEADLIDIIQAARRDKRALAPEGGGTKQGWGRPHDGEKLSLRNFNRVLFYEPEELVLSVQAGMRLCDVDHLLAQHGQCLPFDPPRWESLWSHPEGASTIGGIVATNLSGPARVSMGAARDYVLGCRAVTGRGEAVRTGGRVVKNVTGYDLPKLLSGSFGTLAVMTEVTIKVLPKPTHEATLIAAIPNRAQALTLLRRALGDGSAPRAAAYVPNRVARQMPDLSGAVILVRIDGTQDGIIARKTMLGDFVSGADVVWRDQEDSVAIWKAIRDLTVFDHRANEALWRLSVPPDRAEVIISGLGLETYIADWGGGLITALLPDCTPTQAMQIHDHVAKAGGHAHVIAAPDHLRRAVAVFPPLSPAEAALSRRVKHAFDPDGVLNPRRFWPDW